MKIAFVSSHINKSLQFLWYEEELQKRAIEHIHIIIQIDEQKTQLASDLEKLGIPVYALRHKNVFSHLKNIFKVKAILKKHKIDTVHTTLPFGNLVGQTAAKYAGISKRVTTCENASWAHDFKNKKQEFIDNYTFKSAKKIIAVADSAREYIEQNWKIDKTKLETIYHGLKKEEYENIDPARISRLKQQLAISENDFVVGMIARLEFWKGHTYAIEAMKMIVQKEPNIKLFIFGSKGPDHDKIIKQIDELGLNNNVSYKGFIDDPVALFQLFDIHLHVPINKYVENCGISIIEGMISGRPQILTLSGYAAQSANHLENAIVVDYCNSGSIADAILTLKNNPELAAKISKQSKKDAIAHYSNQVKTDRHIELYKNL